MTASPTDLWIQTARPVDEPSVRLFCFPYAGGSATIFREWGDLLPKSIEVHAIQLPGRPGRMNEPPLDDAAHVVEELIDVIEPLTDLPYAFYGHSMGSLLAFELARRQWIEFKHGPQELFVASRRAPHLPSRNASLHQQPQERVVDFLKSLRVIPPEVLDNDELMNLLLPTLRADLKIDVTYEYAPGPGVACPIHAFSGIDDLYVLKEEISAWSMHAGGDFQLQFLPGNHFFLDHPTQRMALLKAIAKQLAQYQA